jgi:hypothetical protein
MDDNSLKIPGSDGLHWVHLKTAEQLAQAMHQCLPFDVRRLYQPGGISDGIGNEPEGLVALRDGSECLLLMGSFIAGGLQWPTSPAGDNSLSLREKYAAEILVLQERAVEFLPVAQNTNALQFG